MTIVRVFLDVDGVLNAVGNKRDPEQWPDWSASTALGFKINYSPTVGKFFRNLAEDPEVDLVWLTTWCDKANEHISPMLGIPQLEVAGYPPYKGTRWWKYNVVEQWWENNHKPFVWIDDDLNTWADDGAYKWVKSLGDQALAVNPFLWEGLTQAWLDKITNFIEAKRNEAAN